MKKTSIILVLTIILGIFSACVAEKPKIEYLEGVNEYELSVNISDDLKNVTLSEAVTVVNNSEDSWDYVIFNVYANAYAKDCPNLAYYFAPTTYASFNILSLSSNDKTLTYSFNVNMTTLKVDLLEPLKKGEKTRIEIEAEIVVPTSNLRFGLNKNVLNLTGFYPVVAVYDNGFREDDYCKVGDPFYAESSDFKVEIICKPDLVVASSSDSYVEEITESKKIIKIEARSIRDFAISASYGFEVQTSTYENTELRYYSVGKSDAGLLECAVSALAVFSEMIGEYPYSHYSVVDVPYYYGGMEYSSLVFVNSTASDKEAVIIHETAHQWFGMMVGSDAINESWLDEALVTFLTDYYHLKKGDEQKFSTLRQENRKISEDFITLQKRLNPNLIIDLNKSIYEYFNNYEYSMVVYTRGSVLFDIIYEYAGEKRFEKALSDYFNQNCYKIATKESFFKAFKDNKKDISAIVDGFINDKTIMGNFWVSQERVR